MDVSRNGSDEQAALWNGASGQSWVEAQAVLDRMFMPFEQLLVAAAAERPRRRILDVGCGTGSTTLALKRRLGECECIGLDISEPMLEHARSRAKREAAQVQFVCADAEQHAFERATFDMILSRFGVMFFSDSRRAFENLRRAAREQGELCVIAWRSAAENPFMTAAERAAAALLPSAPAREPDAPGQFRFADSTLVRRVLEDSGWSDVEIRPIDVECSFPESELMSYAARLGPVGRALRELDEPTQARVRALIEPAFAPYVEASTVRFSAACWRIGARA